MVLMHGIFNMLTYNSSSWDFNIKFTLTVFNNILSDSPLTVSCTYIFRNVFDQNIKK